ncbi:pentapeptide repeat-containing protein [Vibrio salinus]|uniref:pentapeptide repeat-containing protein n=1 Tax=Vibrio salinus TaxID=2899784 RepID=UPI001E56866A|nr:pentapeptide repeat-containing protein [Vibrio salinus]MCE0495354.1 pentapeptide repeat-containing protein [Vibrio salinus]
MTADTTLPIRNFNENQNLIVTHEAMSLWFADRERWREWAGNDHLILEGEVALDLWRCGREKWNDWCQSQPKADISFKEVIFDSGATVSFFGFEFPNYGEVDFSFAEFRSGEVDFRGTKFGYGDLRFLCTEFGEGKVDFSNSKFGGGEVDFRGIKFGEGVVSFRNSEFGGGEVSFFEAEFGDGNVFFTGAEFGHGNVSFQMARFGHGEVTFDNANFGGHVGFKDVSISEGCTSISFRFASFKSSVEFSTREVLPFIPDFVGTKTTNHFVLTGLKCSFKRKWFTDASKQAERLCRLKEIAEHNKDYKSALRFHADEMRAARWFWPSYSDVFSIFHFIKPFGAGLLDWLFSTCSSYGQSIIKPVLGFLLVVFILIALTMHESNTIEAKNWHPFSSNVVPDACTVDCHRLEGNTRDILYLASTVSLSKAIPFLGGIGLDAAEVRKELNLSARYGVMSSLLSGLSFLFMFLIGLGLRNKFRLR